MLAGLLRNTIFSSLAFFAAGLAGLLLVPLFIGEYGLKGFGLIVLARTFLPTGALAIMDFGVSETTTQTVARARGSGDWQLASEQVSLLAIVSGAVGLATAVSLFCASDWLSHVFQATNEYHESFASVLKVTAISLLIIFPGLVLEGILKGLERYDLLRSLEVLSVLGYALASLLLVRYEQPYETIAYAFLVALLLKYVFALAFLVVPLRASALRPSRWSIAGAADVRTRSLLMFQNKILGALQQQSPPLFIGSLVGPAGVAIYDVLVRIPRFAKSVLSLTASAVLPVSARLEGKGEEERIMAMGRASFWLFPLATFPPLLGGMLLSKAILEVWVGPDMAAYAPWLSAMFTVPLLLTLLSFGQTLTLRRPEFVRSTNRLSVLYLIVQFGVSFALIGLLSERAFILGQVIACALMFPAFLRLLTNEFGLEARGTYTCLLSHGAPATVLAFVCLLLSPYVYVDNWISLAAVFGLWCTIYWAIDYSLVLSTSQRAALVRLFLALTGAKGR